MSYQNLKNIDGILGEVCDASGYKVDCIIACEENSFLNEFRKYREFVFIGGNTILKGNFKI